ncbi:MAG TPA: oligoribonuclease [Candidatus Saccharimonadales bacterium]
MDRTKTWPQQLLWLDLEMTGLDPVNDRVLEVGVIITDFKFRELATFEAVIKQPQRVLNRMKLSPWYDWTGRIRKKAGTVYDTASRNGLLNKVKTDGRPQSQVTADLTKLIKKHIGKERAILAGNSIHMDRQFIRHQWPRIEDLLHYRMLDVSSLKVWMQGAHHLEFKKPDEHRALEDIRGSILELKYYLKLLKKY